MNFQKADFSFKKYVKLTDEIEDYKISKSAIVFKKKKNKNEFHQRMLTVRQFDLLYYDIVNKKNNNITNNNNSNPKGVLLL